MKRTFVLLALLLFAACATSPLGRRQLLMFSDAQLSGMGRTAFSEMRKATPLSSDARANRYVECVANAITSSLPGAAKQRWEVAVFNEDSANAFALPGGYMGVHTGLLKVAENQDQLATVIGHEVAHVLAKHPNERMSTTSLTQSGLQVAQIAAGGSGGAAQKELFAVLGMGAQVGILLPFSRAQESEADLLGLDLMASAGFDPKQSLELWRNMAKAAGAKPPEFLSTHPSGSTRLQTLSTRMARANKLSSDARARGRRPRCTP
ncbi:MAG: putative Zn-dependent protease [Hyphomicrobiaceae bacterium]|jgi:predicted Zn-dependent protease